MLNLVGQCGPLLGTRLYPAAEAPHYVKGQSTCAIFMGCTCVLAVSLRVLLAWENARLDAQYGTLEEQRLRRVQAGEDQKNLDMSGTENYGPEYRYVL